MKYRRRTRVFKRLRSVQLAVILIALIAIEAVLGFTLFFNAEKTAFNGLMSGYGKEVVRAAEKFDAIIAVGAGETPEFTGRISGGTDASIVIDGREYTAAENIGRNLRAGGVTFYALKELCDNNSADAFITENEKVYAVYSKTGVSGYTDLDFFDAAELIGGLDYAGFDGYAVFSPSRRTVIIRDGAAEKISESGETEDVLKAKERSESIKNGWDYAFNLPESDAKVVTATLEETTYAVAIVKLSETDYYFCGYADFADGTFALTGLKRQIILTFALLFAATFGAVIFLTGRGDKNAKGEELREVTANFPPERRESMKEVYVAYSGNKAILVGEILFENLQEIKAVFGREFAERTREILIKRVEETFPFVFQTDYFRVGVIQPDGKKLKTFLRDVRERVSDFNRVAKIDDNNVLVSVKCGFALGDESMQSRDYAYVTAAAEAALKRATEGYINDTERRDYFIYREAQRKLYSRYMFKTDVKGMLAAGDFYLEYQPQYGVKEKRIIGFEALLRVRERARVNASISEIINYAEQSGSMVLLGDFIFREGMKFAKSVENFGVSVSLNVSLVQLMQTGFVDSFLEIYRAFDLRAGLLCLEITESYLAQSIEETLKKLQILKDNGIEIHIDDFGRAYSSFSYMQRLPISAIKIDKTFVGDIEKNRYSELITKTIIEISANLNLKSICEGVETDEQFDIVTAHGCDAVQGFLISPAVEAEAAREMIKSYRYERKNAENTHKMQK